MVVVVVLRLMQEAVVEAAEVGLREVEAVVVPAALQAEEVVLHREEVGEVHQHSQHLQDLMECLPKREKNISCRNRSQADKR